MNLEDFFAAVLPPEGEWWYALCYFHKEPDANAAGINLFFRTRAELAEACLRLDRKGKAVFYCTCTFRESTSTETKSGKARTTKDNAVAIQTLRLDLDVGTGESKYPDRKAALQGVKQILDTFKLPRPYVVSSGRGLHVYWRLDRPMLKEEWEPLAREFKIKLMALDIKQDPAITADVRRILRPPGCTHRKGDPITVKVVADKSAPLDPDEFAKRLGLDADTLAGAGASKLLADDATDDLAIERDFPPADPGKVASRCLAMGHFRKVRGNVEEPLWWALLGVLKFCENGEEAAQKWSSGHPTYEPDKVKEKLDQWSAKATKCQKIYEVGGKAFCDKCPHHGEVSSPIALGYIQLKSPGMLATALTTPTWPHGFGWDPTKEVLYREIYDAETEQTVRRPFSHTKFYVSTRVRDTDGTWALQFKIQRHRGDDSKWVSFSIPRVKTANALDLRRELSAHEVVLMNDKTTNLDLAELLNAYTMGLQTQRVEVHTIPFLGWYCSDPDADPSLTHYALFADRFILGNKALLADGTTEDVLLAKNVPDGLKNLFEVKGTAQQWSDWVQRIYGRPEDTVFRVVLLAKLASPLVALMGSSMYRGSIISLLSKSGGGKTTANMVANTVYGDPSALVISGNPAAGNTLNYTLNQIATLRNLGASMDEITLLPGPIFNEYTYAFTMGKTRQRLDQKGNPRPGYDGFASITCTTSNSSTYEKIETFEPKPEVRLAMQNRVFEVDMNRHCKGALVQDPAVTALINEGLGKYYGAIGREWLTYLLANKETVTADLERAFVKITQTSSDHSQTRFTDYLMATLAVAIRHFNRLGYMQFDVNEIVPWMQFVRDETLADRGKLHAGMDDYFARYFNIHRDRIVFTQHLQLRHRQGRPVGVDEVPQNHDRLRGEVVGRVASKSRRAAFATAPLRDWCREHDISFDGMVTELDRLGYIEHDAVELKANKGQKDPMKTAVRRVSLTGNTILPGSMRIRCLMFDYGKLLNLGSLHPVSDQDEAEGEDVDANSMA